MKRETIIKKKDTISGLTTGTLVVKNPGFIYVAGNKSGRGWRKTLERFPVGVILNSVREISFTY